MIAAHDRARAVLRALLLTCSTGFGLVQTAGAEDAELADRIEIGERIAEYAYRWDRKDAPAFAELFAPEGFLDWAIGGEVAERRVTGRAAITAYARKAFEERLAGKQTRHHFSNLVFRELGETRAVTEHVVLVTHGSNGQPPVPTATGYYRIEWEKQVGEWLMARRTLFLDR